MIYRLWFIYLYFYFWERDWLFTLLPSFYILAVLIAWSLEKDKHPLQWFLIALCFKEKTKRTYRFLVRQSAEIKKNWVVLLLASWSLVLGDTLVLKDWILRSFLPSTHTRRGIDFCDFCLQLLKMCCAGFLQFFRADLQCMEEPGKLCSAPCMDLRMN